MKIKTPSNVKELRDDLLEVYAELRADPRRLAQAAELSNTAGKIIASAKVELEYAIMRGEKPECAFIGDASMKRALPPTLTPPEAITQ